ncbi:hypothetical protein WAF17_18340 [Bernardetia sp. ABR2-2B]|uniref:hypothetical protein n=1 Tax=Bernardetia sp. ABR2-2B TaxID=3127472 RepID=UPI0030D53ED6
MNTDKKSSVKNNLGLEKILNSKSERKYFKHHLSSLSDWKQFEMQLTTLPWEVSNLNMKEFKEKPKHSLARLGIFISSLLLFPLFGYLLSFLNPFLSFFKEYSLVISSFLLMLVLLFIGIFLSEGLKMVDKLKKPIISIEKDQIIVFMPYKKQKVILEKHKIEEIKLIPKEDNNYQLQVSFRKEVLFFSMNLNEDMFKNLVKTLKSWSDTAKIDLST